MTNDVNQTTGGGVLLTDTCSKEDLQHYLLAGLADLTSEQLQEFISRVSQLGLLRPFEDHLHPAGKSRGQVPA